MRRQFKRVSIRNGYAAQNAYNNEAEYFLNLQNARDRKETKKDYKFIQLMFDFNS